MIACIHKGRSAGLDDARMSDAAQVRLFHPLWPEGREFDPVVAETMRHQGWVEQADEVKADDLDGNDPDLDGDKPDGDDLDLDGDDNPPTTGFGHSTIGGPRG